MSAFRHLCMTSGMQSLQKSKAYLSQNLKFQICREAGIKFFSGDIFGFFGYCFMDLIDHEYVEEITKVRHSLNYLPWLMVLITVGGDRIQMVEKRLDTKWSDKMPFEYY